MNKDQVAGRVEDAKGKIKEATGKLTGSEKLRSPKGSSGTRPPARVQSRPTATPGKR